LLTTLHYCRFSSVHLEVYFFLSFERPLEVRRNVERRTR
jgi:hypothetical protein